VAGAGLQRIQALDPVRPAKPAAAGGFLSDFLHPAHSLEFLLMVLRETWITVAIATAGLALALLGAIPATLLVSERLSISRLGTGRMRPLAALLRQVVRWVLVLLRSVPELVWALLFVRVVGLGPTAGVLAIALTYCGMLAKVYAEILESSDAHATDALLANGSGRLPALLYGALPDAAAELVSYTVYRWECAIRGSAIMGFVGAGGLGQRMDESTKMMAGGEVATMLLRVRAAGRRWPTWSRPCCAGGSDEPSPLPPPRNWSTPLLVLAAAGAGDRQLRHAAPRPGRLLHAGSGEHDGRIPGRLRAAGNGDAVLAQDPERGARDALDVGARHPAGGAAGLALALPAAGRWGAGARRRAHRAERAALDTGTGVGGAAAGGRRPRSLRRHAGAGGAHLGRAGTPVRRRAGKRRAAAGSGLRTNGAPALSAFFYATLPQTLPQMLSYTLYRWENNIRAAAVLGVVGAGGLGQMLKYHLSLFQMQSAATVVLAMLLLVALVDAISFALRRALTRS
jgi:phosphonate transport system permease protein